MSGEIVAVGFTLQGAHLRRYRHSQPEPHRWGEFDRRYLILSRDPGHVMMILSPRTLRDQPIQSAVDLLEAGRT